MHVTVQDAKIALRRDIRARLRALTAEQRVAASAAACALLRSQSLWQQARSVLFYAPLPIELDVWPLLPEALADGKQVGLPRFAPESGSYVACEIKQPATDLASGHFGIREPLVHCRPLPLKLDLILVPGLAFDLQCRRLGRGKGFYDQFLAAVSGTTCGVAFDEQIVPEVPVEPHDLDLNCMLTPTRWVRRSPRAVLE